MKRLIIWGVVLTLIGMTVGFVYAESIQPPDYGPDLVVPAPRIIEREVPPGPPKIIQRVVYRYPPAYVRATAPLGAKQNVLTFCAPTVAAARGDTTPQPRTELIRSVVHKSSWFPLGRGDLLVTSAASNGDLLARDFKVRDDFGVRASDSVTVRYGRLNIGKELVRGAAWYVAYRGLEVLIRAILIGNPGRSWAQEGL